MASKSDNRRTSTQPTALTDDAGFGAGEQAVLERFAEMDAEARYHRVRNDQKDLSAKLEKLVPGTSWFFTKARVGVGSGSQLSQAMAVDRAVRLKEESAFELPTVRTVIRVDDQASPMLAVRQQDAATGSLRIDLKVPLEPTEIGFGRRRRWQITRTTAKDVVLGALPEELHHHVGPCVPIDHGRKMEVRLLQEDAIDEISSLLGLSLGTVAQVNSKALHRETAIAAMAFRAAQQNPQRMARTPSDGAFLAEDEEEINQTRRRRSSIGDIADLFDDEDSQAQGEEDVSEEDPEEVRASLQRAFDTFDARVARSAFLTKAADQGRARHLEPWWAQRSGGAVKEVTYRTVPLRR